MFTKILLDHRFGVGESPAKREHARAPAGDPGGRTLRARRSGRADGARRRQAPRRPAGGFLIELDALLKPHSVAVLGASERPSVGRTIVENPERIGFQGEIYPINPRYETLLGRRCYRSVEELPDGVDVLAFCVNHERVLGGLRKGVRAAVAFDAGFAESDDAGRDDTWTLVFLLDAGAFVRTLPEGTYRMTLTYRRAGAGQGRRLLRRNASMAFETATLDFGVSAASA